MKNISTYIVEKFKITKNTIKNHNTVHDGDTCFIVSLNSFSGLQKTFDLNLAENTCTIKKLNENEVRYQFNSTKKEVHFEPPKLCKSSVNKNGYYQLAINNFGCFGLFIPEDQYIKFIKELYPTFDENKEYKNFTMTKDTDINRSVIEKYFDISKLSGGVDVINLTKDFSYLKSVLNKVKR